MAASFFNRVTRRLAGMIDRVETDEPLVALTFDDGPDPTSTPQMLDLLQRHQAKATFFCVGERAAEHPELMARMVKEGHAIGNHSWSHDRFPLMSSRERVRQLERAQALIPPQRIKMFRPPYGDYSFASAFDVWRKGYQGVAWDILIWDWCERDGERMLALLDEKVRPGSIVLLHDALYKYNPDDHPQRDVLLAVLDEWLGRNSQRYRFVTVPELLESSRLCIRRSIRRILPAEESPAYDA